MEFEFVLGLFSLGGEGCFQPSTLGHCFQVFSTMQGKTMAIGQALLWFCSKALITLVLQASTYVAESWPLARLQVLQNSGSQMFMLRVNTLSSPLTKSKNEKNKEHRLCSNIKVHVSVH